MGFDRGGNYPQDQGTQQGNYGNNNFTFDRGFFRDNGNSNLYFENPQDQSGAQNAFSILSNYNPPRDTQMFMIQPQNPQESGGFATNQSLLNQPYDMAGYAAAGMQPNDKAIAVFNNYPQSFQDPNEFKFMLAHELNHIKYGHPGEGMAREQSFQVPSAYSSGAMFSPWTAKNEEKQADIGGMRDYLNAGYDPSLFMKGAVSDFTNALPTLDPRDTHYSSGDRSNYLKQAFMGWLTERQNAQDMGNLLNNLRGR